MRNYVRKTERVKAASDVIDRAVATSPLAAAKLFTLT